MGEAVTDAIVPAVTRALERTLGTRRDLTDFYAFAASDPKLGPLVERFRGLKPPRFPTLFECLVNAIACQQVTLTLGIRLLNQLAEAYGPVVSGEDGPTIGLPSPETLAAVDPEDLRALQFSRQKARALTELAEAIVQGELDLEAMSELDEETVRRRLRQLWGVGRWTAEYVLLRGLGRLHIFPGDGVGARNGLRRWLDLSEKLGYDGVRRTVLVDKQGRILASTLDLPFLSPGEHLTFYRKAITRQEPTIETVPFELDLAEEPKGHLHVMAVAPLRMAPWGVAVGGDAGETFAGVRELQRGLVLLGIIALASIWTVTLVGTRRLVRPVQRLTEAAHRTANGDLYTPLQVPEGGEIGVMAAALEQMREQLLVNIQELETRNDHLDIRLHRQDGQVTMTLVDDGRGFDVAAVTSATDRGRGLGLAGMRQRASLAGGRLTIASAHGRGTTIRVVLPIEEDKQEQHESQRPAGVDSTPHRR